MQRGILLGALLVMIVAAGTVAANGSTYESAVLVDNPIGYWRLGESEGLQADDSSGNDLHSVYIDGVTLGETGALTDDPDTAAHFDGSTGYVHVSADPRLNQLTNNFTIEAWARFSEEESDWGIIVSTRDQNHGYGFGADADTSALAYSSYGVQRYSVPFSLPTTQWVHLAVTLDVSNDAHFYVNGEPEAVVEGASPALTNSQVFNVGRSVIPSTQTGSYGHLDGGLDEVAIYGHSLDAYRIKTHYLAGIDELWRLADANEDDMVGGSDLDIVRAWWGREVPAGSTIQGDLNSDGYVGGGDLDLVRSYWGQGIPPAPNAVPEPSTVLLCLLGAVAVTVGWRQRAVLLLAVLVVMVAAGTVLANGSSYESAILADNPLGYWRLGEESLSDAFDSSGNGYDGIYFGGVALARPGALPSDPDTSVLLDPTGYVDMGERDVFKNLTNDFTVEAWTDGIGAVVSTRWFTVGLYQRGFALTVSEDQLVFTAYDIKDYVLPYDMPPDTWSHVAAVFDSANDVQFYIDGQHQGTIGGSRWCAESRGPMNIGQHPFPHPTTGSQGRYSGGLDEVAIYGHSLSGLDIKTHYLTATGELWRLADANEDDMVGGSDLDIVRAWWGREVPVGSTIQGDLNNDGFVGGGDLDLVRSYWGQGIPPTPNAVPEPSAGLLCLTLLAFGWWRRHRAA